MSAHRRHGLLGCLATLALLLSGGISDAQPAYSVIDLGPAPDLVMPPTPYSCTPQCQEHTLMNAKGQLVMSRQLRSFDSYFWEPGLATPILIDSHLDDEVRSVAISSNGLVVGTSDGGFATPFIWSRSAGRKSLCCADYWYPLGVNSSGIVVGTELFGGYHAAIWKDGPNPTFIDDLPIAGGGPWEVFEQARTISDDGTIAGVGKLRTASGAVETHYFVLIPASGGNALDRSDWTVSATESSPDDPPLQSIDGNLNTRWSTGNAQHDSQGFKVAWPGDRTIARIRVEVGPSANDYPRTCGIWVSDAAGHVTRIECAADASGVVDVSFSAVAVHTIEVWQWGTSPWWWSIAEFNVYRP